MDLIGGLDLKRTFAQLLSFCDNRIARSSEGDDQSLGCNLEGAAYFERNIANAAKVMSISRGRIPRSKKLLSSTGDHFLMIDAYE